MTSPVRRRAIALLGVALALAAGCAAGGVRRSSARQRDMPCTEAVRVARGALMRLGYDARVVTPPQAGTPGTIVGEKIGGYSQMSHEATRVYRATVTVTCSNAGAQFDAETDEPLPGSLTFKSDFITAIRAVAARRLQRPPRADNRPETGIVIALEPLRGLEARGAFGVDLPAAGITPVRLRIDNRTDRTYVFAASRVRLQMQEGDRAAALPPAEAAARAGTAAPALEREHLADAVLAPNATLSGYLYFPAAAYRRATVVLIDQASEEEEGFSVEF